MTPPDTSRYRCLIIAPVAPDLAEELRALQRVLGNQRRLGPHITLIPPWTHVTASVINTAAGAGWEPQTNQAVQSSGLEPLYRVIRDAGAQFSNPIDLILGPGETFAPRTPTVHLGIQRSEPSSVEKLQRLRHQLATGVEEVSGQHPDDRTNFGFVPHVTLRTRTPQNDIDTYLHLLRNYEQPWLLDTVVLCVQEPFGNGPWIPVFEYPLPRPRASGVGSLELRSWQLQHSNPEHSGWLKPLLPEIAEGFGPDGLNLSLVVEIENHDLPNEPELAAVVLGRAVGDVAILEHISVRGDFQRLGIGRRVVNEWLHRAKRNGHLRVVAMTQHPLLEACGFQGSAELSIKLQ